jgi:DNA-binding transcriptional LysR family regulator
LASSAPALKIGVAREVPLLLRQLEYLVALAHEKHFAHAAERCEISQPALSLALKQLESELGVAIVERGNRFRGFTQEGEIVLKWARRVLADEETLKQELRLRSASLSGRLRLGVIPSATSTSSLLSTSFVREHPGVSISDVEMTSTDILRALMSFELDAGITYIDNEPLEHVRTHAIGKEEYVLVTPADSPLAGRSTVTWTEVATLPLCLLHRDMQNRRIIEAIFESVGVRPNARIETNSMISKYCYLRAGWSTIMPRSFVEWLAPPAGLHIARIIEPSVVKTVGLVIVDRTPVPPLLLGFWGHVERESPLVRLEDSAAIRI